MSEIQSIADITWFKYIFYAGVGLVSVINALIYHIFTGLKKDFEKIKKVVDEDHDKLNEMRTEHGIYHPKNGNK